MSKIGFIDVEVYDKEPEIKENECWEQGTFLVHGYDDVLWTDDAEAAAQYVLESIRRMAHDTLR